MAAHVDGVIVRRWNKTRYSISSILPDLNAHELAHHFCASI